MPAYPFPFRRILWLLLTLSVGLLTMAISGCPGGETQDTQEAEDKALGLLATLGPKDRLGAWSVPKLPPVKDRMQAVHATLLPNGKVLIVNGSSLRLQGTGLPLVPFKLIDTGNYDVTNNTAIFDPGTYDLEGAAVEAQMASPEAAVPPAVDPIPLPPESEDAPSPDVAAGLKPRLPEQLRTRFTRIDSPPNPVDGKPNDLFCGGHLQTPDGDVLFVSGTDKYDVPGVQGWTGTVLANLFDWQTGTWQPAGELEDGHWYPTLLPLADGQIATISGWAAKLNGRHSVMSTWVEFYDWTQPPEKAWTAVDVAGFPDGPFTAPGGLDHYPRIHELRDGRFMITGEGSGGGNKEIKRTYFMTITPAATPGAAPDVSFELAALRTEPRRIYGTAVVDPNSENGDVLLIGGQLATEGALIGPSYPPKNPEKAVTALMERFTPPTADDPKGTWEVVPDFMGDRPTDARSNHYATLLPTKQLLVTSGGMYRFYRPNFQPLLYTPDPEAPGGYRREAMNPGTQARVYHCTTLLLPDGRVFVAGGNAAYAVRSKDGKDVRIDTYFKALLPPPLDFPLPAWLDKGRYALPAENYQIEFFYPPYLFLPGPRPVITAAPETLEYGASHSLSVSHMTDGASLVLMKLGSSTHGWDMGQRLADLEFTQDLAAGQLTFQAPTDRHLSPPAYYMLFYVNDQGHPSVAKIVQLKPAEA